MRSRSTMAAVALAAALVVAPSLSVSAASDGGASPAVTSPVSKVAPTKAAPTTKPAAKAPASAPTTKPAPKEPTDTSAAVDLAKQAYEAAKAGNWWFFAAAVILLLMFLLKLLGQKLGFWEKLGRWRYVIVPVLSLAAALLAAFQGGASVSGAIGVFTASWATASLQELWSHGILGKPRASTVAAAAAPAVPPKDA